jgi:hypothetical protein
MINLPEKAFFSPTFRLAFSAINLQDKKSKHEQDVVK